MASDCPAGRYVVYRPGDEAVRAVNRQWFKKNGGITDPSHCGRVNAARLQTIGTELELVISSSIDQLIHSPQWRRQGGHGAPNAFFC